jgi:hypothetical protein
LPTILKKGVKVLDRKAEYFILATLNPVGNPTFKPIGESLAVF